MPAKDIIARFERATLEELGKLGFRKRLRAVFTREMGAESLGWVGFNRGTHPADGLISVHPIVGLRHQPTERLIATLLEEKFHSFSPATMSEPLRYLVPESERRFWEFNANTFAVTFSAMMEALVSWGLPYIEENASLSAMTRAMVALGERLNQKNAVRLPVMHYLLGEHALAEQCLERELAKREGRRNPEADRYRRFSEALRRKMAAEP